MEKEIVKKKIETLGIKKSHVARVIGCTSAELSNYLHDRRPLRAECEIKLHSYLFGKTA